MQDGNFKGNSQFGEKYIHCNGKAEGNEKVMRKWMFALFLEINFGPRFCMYVCKFRLSYYNHLLFSSI